MCEREGQLLVVPTTGCPHCGHLWPHAHEAASRIVSPEGRWEHVVQWVWCPRMEVLQEMPLFFEITSATLVHLHDDAEREELLNLLHRADYVGAGTDLWLGDLESSLAGAGRDAIHVLPDASVFTRTVRYLEEFAPQWEDEFISFDHPIVGYVGDIGAHIEWRTLVELASRATVIAVGYPMGNERVPSEVVWLHASYPELLGALAYIDVGVVPFRDPLFEDVMEYLAAGVPVVHYGAALAPSPFALAAKTDRDFLGGVEELLSSRPPRKEVRELAFEMTWVKKARAIWRIAGRHHAGMCRTG